MAAGADVRMQGFRRRSEVPGALEWIDRNASAAGRRGRGARRSRRAACSPATSSRRSTCPASTARRWTVTRCAAKTRPARANTTRCRCRCSARSCPGSRSTAVRPPGSAVRIMTGAPLPDRRRRRRARRVRHRVGGRDRRSRDPSRPASTSASRGEDVAAGTSVLSAGRRLRAQDVGLVASLGSVAK